MSSPSRSHWKDPELRCRNLLPSGVFFQIHARIQPSDISVVCLVIPEILAWYCDPWRSLDLRDSFSLNLDWFPVKTPTIYLKTSSAKSRDLLESDMARPAAVCTRPKCVHPIPTDYFAFCDWFSWRWFHLDGWWQWMYRNQLCERLINCSLWFIGWTKGYLIRDCFRNHLLSCLPRRPGEWQFEWITLSPGSFLCSATDSSIASISVSLNRIHRRISWGTSCNDFGHSRNCPGEEWEHPVDKGNIFLSGKGINSDRAWPKDNAAAICHCMIVCP
jgi:hypothetical protein